MAILSHWARGGDLMETAGVVDGIPTQEADGRTVLVGDDPPPIDLLFVDPAVPNRREDGRASGPSERVAAGSATPLLIMPQRAMDLVAKRARRSKQVVDELVAPEGHEALRREGAR